VSLGDEALPNSASMAADTAATVLTLLLIGSDIVVLLQGRIWEHAAINKTVVTYLCWGVQRLK
jgi:hypothetical protein